MRSAASRPRGRRTGPSRCRARRWRGRPRPGGEARVPSASRPACRRPQQLPQVRPPGWPPGLRPRSWRSAARRSARPSSERPRPSRCRRRHVPERASCRPHLRASASRRGRCRERCSIVCQSSTRQRRLELEVFLCVGDAAADAGEVRVQRRGVLVDHVAVAAGGVALPDLDQRVGHGATAALAHATVDDDALAHAARRGAGS